VPSTHRTPGNPEAPLLDLPDLDHTEDNGEVDVGAFELSMGEELDLEDGEGTADGFEIGIQERDDPGSDEPATDLEIGMAELLDALPEEAPAHDNDAPVPLGSELDLHLDVPLEADDTSTDAELGDDGLEDLPELLDDGDEGDAGPELEGTLLPGAPEGRIPTGPRLTPEWLLLGTACSALWAFGTDVLGSGEHLMRFGSERKSDALPSGTSASSLCLDGAGNAVLATNRGLLEVSPAGSSSWLEAPEPARGSGADVVQLCGAPGTTTLWARLTNGTLLRRRGSSWERHEAGGTVRSLSSTQHQITLLVVADRPTLQLSSDGGSSFRERLLPEPAATVALGAAPVALSLGPLLVISDAERGVCVSRDDGASFRLITGAVNATAVALGEHQGKLKLFVALYREGRDTSELIEVDVQTLAAASVAELTGESDEDAEETGRTAALIVADGYLWAAGGFGLARLR
jgi:hypothetical protein